MKNKKGLSALFIRMECRRRSPSAAHCLLVGFVVLVVAVVVVAVVGLISGVVADQNHRVYLQASALRLPSVE